MFILALNQETLKSEKPSIVFIPEGENEISATVNGQAGVVTVKMNPDKKDEITAKFQADLEAKLSQTVRPYLDFDHEMKVASALPKRFFYEDGKGLMLEIEWTGKGKQAVEAKDYSYFSPVFNLSDDGIPMGLTPKTAIGGLVNDPAFRTYKPIAASHQTNQTKYNMKELIASGLLTESESKTEGALQIAASRFVEATQKANQVEALNQTIKDLQTQIGEKNKEVAEREVELAVEAGHILAKDDKSKEFWKKQIIEAKSKDELNEVLHTLKASKASNGSNMTGNIVEAKSGEVQGSKDKRMEKAQIQAKQELGNDAEFTDVWARATEIDPEAFN